MPDAAEHPASVRSEPADRPSDEPSRRILARAERSSPAVLEPRARSLLSHVLGFEVPNVRLYPSANLGGVAGERGVDAIAYPESVLFAPGKYDARHGAGLALLGHELTHVARLRGQVLARREPSHSGGEGEEELALRNERWLLRHFDQTENERERPPVMLPDQPTTVAAMPGSERAAAVAPRAALSDRDLGEPAGPATTRPPAAELSSAQIRMLKDEVYRDLLARVRIEFERGG